MLEKDGDDQFDQQCKKDGSITKSQEKKEYLTCNKKKKG
jgi:hypothetical protein